MSLSIYDVLTGFLGENSHELCVAWLYRKLVVTIQEAVTGMSLAYLPWQAANSTIIEVCNYAPLILPKMQDLELLMLIWHSFPRWGREPVASAFAYTGGQCISYDKLQPLPALITQDARPKLVDAALTLMSRMGQGAFLQLFWSQRRPVHPKRTTTCDRCYFMINRKISDCYHISINAKCQTGDSTRRLTGTGLRYDRQDSLGWDFVRFWNRTETFFRSNAGSLVSYPEQLLTLSGWHSSNSSHHNTVPWYHAFPSQSHPLDLQAHLETARSSENTSHRVNGIPASQWPEVCIQFEHSSQFTSPNCFSSVSMGFINNPETPWAVWVWAIAWWFRSQC